MSKFVWPRRMPAPSPLVLALTMIALVSLAGTAPNAVAAAGSSIRPLTFPLCFEPDPSSRDGFTARGAGLTLHLTANTVTLATGSGGKVRLDLVGASRDSSLTGQEKLPGRANHLIGSDPRRWRTHVPLFGRVRAENVYRGVALEYYGAQSRLEYDFIVEPGADPGVIRWRARGLRSARIDEDGSLALETSDGTLRQPKPVLYQPNGEKRAPVTGSFSLERLGIHEYVIGFQIGAYDRSRPLVIDPQILYSTYLGGSGIDEGHGVFLQGGFVYVTGSTTSANFPHSSGGLNGTKDAFVMKLDPSVPGNASLIYTTFLGGSGEDTGFDLVVDIQGRAGVIGETRSVDFPIFRGLMADPGDGAIADGFVSRLSPTGDALTYSTYLGGEFSDQLTAVDTTPDGTLWIAGTSSSSTFPTVRAFQPARRGSTDAIFARIDPAASGVASLLYSTYLGGSAADAANGVAFKSSAEVVVTGSTRSNDFPVSPSGFASVRGGSDAFVATLVPSVSGSASLRAATLLGGNGDDSGGDIRAQADALFVVGRTASSDFPVSEDAMQGDSPGTDAFFAIVNPNHSGLFYSTYLGGDLEDMATGLQVDSTGSALIVGTTNSLNFPTVKELMKDPRDGRNDIFIARFTRRARINYSTYLGGNNDDRANAVAADSLGTPIVIGRTSSSTFPVASQLQLSQGGPDAFLTVLSSGPPNPPIQVTASAPSSQHIHLNWIDDSVNESHFIVQRKIGTGPFAFLQNAPPGTESGMTTLIASDPNKTYTFRVFAANADGLSEPSNEVVITTIAAPTDLTGTGTESKGIKTINLIWRDNSTGETGFSIERSVNRGRFQQIGVAPADADGFTDPSPSDAVAYQVRAVYSQGFSSYSNLFAYEFRPVAPANLHGFLVQESNGSIHSFLTWVNRSRLADVINIYRSVDGGPVQLRTSLAGDESRFEDFEIQANHKYSYTVRAQLAGVESPASNSASILVARLAAPKNLEATLISSTQAQLSFQDDALGEASYEVQRKVGAGAFSFLTRQVNIGGPDTGIRKFVVAAVSGETNTFRVRVLIINGTAPADEIPFTSPFSNEASVNSLLPPVPTEVTVSAGDSVTSTIRWKDNSLGETGFVVEKSVNRSAFVVFRTLPGNTTSTVDATRATNQSRSYRVRARNGIGDSAPSTAAAVEMLAAPSNLTGAVARGGGTTLKWSDNSLAETSFSIEVRLQFSSTFKVVGSAAANQTSFLVPQQTAAVESARVRAAAAGSLSSYSNALSAQPVDQPADMTAAATDSTTVHLAWTDNSGNEEGFQLQRRGAGKPWTTIQDLPVDAETAVDPTAASEFEYQYRVRAVSGISASEWCPEWPLVTTLNAPVELVSKRTTRGLRLVWLDRSARETGYEVERRIGSGVWERIRRLGANVDRFTDEKAPWGRKLRYRVRATAANAMSSYSNEVKAGR